MLCGKDSATLRCSLGSIDYSDGSILKVLSYEFSEAELQLILSSGALRDELAGQGRPLGAQDSLNVHVHCASAYLPRYNSSTD